MRYIKEGNKYSEIVVGSRQDVFPLMGFGDQIIYLRIKSKYK